MSRMGGNYYNSKRDSLTVEKFSTVGEYVRYTNQTHELNSSGSRMTGTGGFVSAIEFFGTHTYEDAVTLAEQGWPEGVAMIADRRDKFEAFLSAQRLARCGNYGYEVTGDWLDVGRYLSGEPECFGVEQNDGEILQQRVVGLRLNNTVSCAVSTEQIIKRGLVTLLAVDILEQCGVRVELTLCQSTHYDNNQREFSLTIKEPNQPVDIDRLAFWIAHPSAFRRFGFSFFELGGHPSNMAHVSTMHDFGKVPGVIEIESYESAGVSDEDIVEDVKKIAAACGLTGEVGSI